MKTKSLEELMAEFGQLAGPGDVTPDHTGPAPAPIAEPVPSVDDGLLEALSESMPPSYSGEPTPGQRPMDTSGVKVRIPWTVLTRKPSPEPQVTVGPIDIVSRTPAKTHPPAKLRKALDGMRFRKPSK